MKAKYFKRLRAELQYYEVVVTEALFGDLYWWKDPTIILAYNHQNACERYNKRKNNKKFVGSETSPQWARYKVKLADSIKHERHFKYFR